MSYNFVSYIKADKKFNLKKITIVCHSFQVRQCFMKKKKPASSAHNSITLKCFSWGKKTIILCLAA